MRRSADASNLNAMNATSDPLHECVELPDGMTLAARFFPPDATPRGAILLPAAMGVTQRYYAEFAKWLAGQGYLAATFDYRGMGLSAPTTLRSCRVDVGDWAQVDCKAMIESLRARAPACKLFVVGHSLGAQIVGMIPNRQAIDGVVMVASGSGYWRTMAPPTKFAALWMWYVLVPLLTPVLGYFPGRLLRAVGDLPRGAVMQWRRWCLHPEYLLGAETELRAAYADVRTPVLSLSFTDDEMMSAASTEALHRFYANAPITHMRLAPHDIGARRIGHLGFFRREFSATLWPRVTQWLESRL